MSLDVPILKFDLVIKMSQGSPLSEANLSFPPILRELYHSQGIISFSGLKSLNHHGDINNYVGTN